MDGAKRSDLAQSVAQDVLVVSAEDSPTGPASSASSSSLSNSGPENLTARSQLFRRPPRFRSRPSRELGTYQEDVYDEDATQDSKAEFPFAVMSKTRQLQDDITSDRTTSATKVQQEKVPTTRPKRKANSRDMVTPQPASVSQTSSSLTSLTNEPTGSGVRDEGASFPDHRAELARLSPRGKGSQARKEGSEGTPSMGSSFSDIDGTSI